MKTRLEKYSESFHGPQTLGFEGRMQCAGYDVLKDIRTFRKHARAHNHILTRFWDSDQAFSHLQQSDAGGRGEEARGLVDLSIGRVSRSEMNRSGIILQDTSGLRLKQGGTSRIAGSAGMETSAV